MSTSQKELEPGFELTLEGVPVLGPGRQSSGR